MKTLTTTVRTELVEVYGESLSLRTTTRNPLVQWLYAITMFMILSVSGWGACTGTNTGTWTTSTATYSKTDQTVQSDAADYYTITVVTSGEITLSIENTDGKQDLTATLYSDGTCGTSMWSATAKDGNTISTTRSVSAGTYSIRIVGSSSDKNTDYDVSGTYISSTANAINDSFTVVNNTTVNGNVISNDTGTGISVTTWGTPSHGALSGKTTAGAFTYTPTTNYSGSDSFTYKITDSGGKTSTATVNITVLPVSTSVDTDGGRDFTKRKQVSLAGDVTVIGNTVLCPLVGGVCTESSDGTSNANETLSLVASSSTLTIPSTATVKWARLYWQGRMKAGNTWSATNKASAKAIRLKSPTAAFTTVSNVSLDTISYNSSPVYPIYSASADVTAMVAAGKSGVYAVDSLFTKAGKSYDDDDDDGLGYYGAWTLVVVYEVPGATQVRDVTVFDGYKRVTGTDDSASVNIAVDGFLTPSGGDVKSEVYVFAGEGDKYISGDTLEMAGATFNTTLNNYWSNNEFDSRVDTSGTRNPSVTNNNGIDVHKYNVGETPGAKNVITNKETGAKFKFTTSGDHYFPSVLVFATDIYSPNISIVKTPSTSANGTLAAGDKIDYTAVFKNVGQENAKNIYIYDDFTQNKQYDINGSLTNPLVALSDLLDRNATKVLQSIRLSDADSTTWNCPLGTSGLAGCTGGNDANCSVEYEDGNTSKMTKIWCNLPSVAVNQTFTMKFSVNLSEEPDTKGQNVKVSNQMFASYYNALVGGSSLESSSNFADAGNYYAQLGSIQDAWETDIAGNPPALGARKIRTKIVGKPATLTVASLTTTNDSYSNYTSSLIGWRIIPTASCGTGADDGITTWSDVNLSATGGGNPQTITFTPPSAGKDFKIQFAPKNSGYMDRSCSNDSFAIRPNDFNSTITLNQQFIAGQPTALTFRADQFGGTGTVGYNENEYSSFVVDVNISDNTKTCAQPSIHFNPSINFANGTVTDDYNLTNVGDFTVTMYENLGLEYAVVDTIDTPDSDRLITPHTQTISVVPDHFNITAHMTNGSNGFTYLSNFENNASLDQGISAFLDINVTAQALGDTNTTNYTSQCYATNGNLSLATTIPVVTPAGSLTQALWYDDINSSSQGSFPIANNPYTPIPYPALRFATGDINGTGVIQIRLNFDRNETLVVNPFIAILNSITATDSDTVTGTGTLTHSENNATFVYGRVIPKDVRAFGSTTPFSTSGWYEVYNIYSLGGIALPASRNDAMWYINTQHSDVNDGDANVTHLNAAPLLISQAAANGVEVYAFPAQALGGYLAHINTDPWLWYGPTALGYADPGINIDGTVDAIIDGNDCIHHPCLNINVVPPIGATGSARTINEQTKASKTSTGTAGAGAWKSTTDYAPAVR